MRSSWLTGTFALLLLAGCATRQEGEAVADKAAEAPHAHGAPSPATGPTHAHSVALEIPTIFHGVYDGSLEACARPSDQRLTLSAREVRFHESLGTVRAVTYAGTGAIGVEADYEGEGERWRSLRIFQLTENGQKLTVRADGAPFDRVRCPRGTR